MFLIFYFFIMVSHVWGEETLQSIPPVVNFSFPNGSVPRLQDALEDIFNRTQSEKQNGLHSITPIGGRFHPCTTIREHPVFEEVAEVWCEFAKVLTRPHLHLQRDVIFEPGVPGAYATAEEFAKVCQRGNHLIHRDCPYTVNPALRGENKLTLIVSMNMPAVDPYEDEKERVLVGTSVYNQHGQNPYHVLAQKIEEVTILVMSKHSMHSTSHDCVPEDLVDLPHSYLVKRALFQGYFVGPDMDDVDWNKVGQVINNKECDQKIYKTLKNDLNSVYPDAFRIFTDKVSRFPKPFPESLDPFRRAARETEDRFCTFKTTDDVPEEDRPLHKFLLLQRQMFEFTDFFVMALRRLAESKHAPSLEKTILRVANAIQQNNPNDEINL